MKANERGVSVSKISEILDLKNFTKDINLKVVLI